MKEIYIIKNNINDKVFIGAAKNTSKRYSKILYNASKDDSKNSPLLQAIRELGYENFYYQILETDVLDQLAESVVSYYINKYNSMMPNGYNLVGRFLYDGINKGLDTNTLHQIMECLIFSNISIKTIAKTLNCTESLIRDISHGKKYRQKYLDYPLRGSKKSYNVELIKQIKYSLKYELDKNIDDIAKEYKVSIISVKNINNGTAYAFSNEYYPLRNLDKEIILESTINDAIKQEINNNPTKSLKDIARKFNVSISYVEKISSKPFNSKYGKTIPLSIVREIENALQFSERSMRLIALEYGISPTTVNNINSGLIRRYKDPSRIYPIRDFRYKF